MGCGCADNNNSDESYDAKIKRRRESGSEVLRGRNGRKPALVKKRSTKASNNEPPLKKTLSNDAKSTKVVAPPPSVSKRGTGSKNGAEISVDVSKFVKEAKGDLRDRYIVKSVIGKGAYGEVKLVNDKITGNPRAMKVIPKEGYGKISNPTISTEIQTLKSLDHPNIIKIYEFYQDDDSFYLITEYCSGGELYDRIIAMKSFSERKAAELMKQILSAVTYCHARKIVHRDIKPENLLFESPAADANLKVIDFGTSMIFKNTQLKQKLGTPYYIAPEVLKKSYNEKCDVWSSGVILYILLSGTPPFYGNTDQEILKRVLDGRYSFRGELWGSISAEAKSLITGMLKYDPDKRITAFDALNHPWITKYTTLKAHDEKLNVLSLKRLQSFKVRNQLQQAVIAYIANHLQSQETMNKLKEVFQQFDKNGDGVLERNELLEGYMKLGKTKKQAARIVDKIMNQIDLNNNGTIDYSEFLMANLRHEDITSSEKLKEAFKIFDKDGDGHITVKEIKEVLGGNDEAVAELVKAADLDGDGQISFDEFTQMMMKLYRGD
eukprot:TRINITY_DN599_c0_g3_i6.p1 TRINITY_DN599_c0_g3~~TRINITY_DN599_c0_g3_i6.p1  ORF type:complete len:550 (-),score=147.22 TRINITY_DN599_c0_g3_i6:103-1752(-)